jgi:HSP20 family molecular chaperone IbpA
MDSSKHRGFSMREIVIEKVIRNEQQSPSLIDQFDALKDISFELGRLTDEHKEPGRVETWVDRLRHQFRRSQIDAAHTRHFTVTMAAPGFATGQMRIVVTENKVELRGEQNQTLREIALPDDVDPRTVYAVFDNGLLQLTGTKFDPEEEFLIPRRNLLPHDKRAANGTA